MNITNIECPIFLLNHIKSEVEIKEEEVDDYVQTSGEEFAEDSQEEYVSSLQNSSNSSSCDADSSSSTTKNMSIGFHLLSKTDVLSSNGKTYPVFRQENKVSRRCKRCCNMLDPVEKYKRIRELNNQASMRYRAKKKWEREQLEQMLVNEKDRNVLLRKEFNMLTKEATYVEKVLKIYLTSKRITPYSLDSSD
ncbi:UNVERIFIED_CONTAM: hypothetical protein RMT77_015153 [Armadillidium vulgare]